MPTHSIDFQVALNLGDTAPLKALTWTFPPRKAVQKLSVIRTSALGSNKV